MPLFFALYIIKKGDICMPNYSQHFNTKKTPQSESIPGKKMVENNAGGYAFSINHFAQLHRFLVLGAEGGSYYVSERKMTIDNAKSAQQAIEEDPYRVVDMVVEVSSSGRAPKNDPALFVLGMVVGMSYDKDARHYAMDALPKVARTATHLYHFLTYVQAFRGWGRSLRKGVANWYNNMTPERLALQVVKYRQRDGWSHRDVLRKSHPIAQDDMHQKIYHYVTQGELPLGDSTGAMNIIFAFEEAQRLNVKSKDDKKRMIALIEEYNMPWETIPTEATADKDVLTALMYKMPIMALTRQLSKLTMRGVLAEGKWDEINFVTGQLTNEEAIRKSRIHPIQILAALNTYSKGRGARGTGSWTPVRAITDALNEAFYLSFGNIESTGKRIMIALDLSASMTWDDINGIPGLRPREASAAMAMVTARTEKNYTVTGFTSGGFQSSRSRGRGYGGISPLQISPSQRLDNIVSYIERQPAGGTDCALPMLYATDSKTTYDAFIVYTDNETWAGGIHPSQALKEYRQKMGINAKLIVVGMTATGFSIADPDDDGMLDVVGFDTAAPNVMSNFIMGKI